MSRGRAWWARAAGCIAGLALVACSAADDGGGDVGDGGDVGRDGTRNSRGMSSETAVGGTVTVLAAASLTEAFEEVGDRLADEYPDLEVTFSFGPSSGLAEQVIAGAPADVLATADVATMQKVVDSGEATGEPAVFATNTLTLVVPPGNPGEVTELRDLGRDDLRVAICEPRVPCGAAAEKLLSAAGVHAAPDTLTTDVKEALALVTLGEADAALVYGSDVTAAGNQVEPVPFENVDPVVNEYPIALLRGAPNPDGARIVMDAITGEIGRSALAAAGFAAP
ncbi:molybdate ABC transporter substrate-binding protein [Phytoactinopolyspora halotolerans]|uniref:Molybdate ABC transporter substrate-binding protein n=1 Tax=Phytoactinopolyspora halotolerans TaxID=1981512 RepID=A0A6L9S5B0_9ACTN|nr:molybdate ABC transporter substrate-binding protein [Phytoactinopolyspora halotolerans]NED99823.1 molybdate ABC transporter substrate-binding protein [Phytoactinopolyspora halotolerans]